MWKPCLASGLIKQASGSITPTPPTPFPPQFASLCLEGLGDKAASFKQGQAEVFTVEQALNS